MRGTLAVAPQIAQMTTGLLGPAGAARIADVDEFRCVVCQLDGNLGRGDDASAVIVEYRNGAILRIAHARCSASTVIPVDGPIPDQPIGEVDVATLPMCMPGPDGEQLAVLLLDRSDASGFFTPGGGFIDPWFQQLLTGGWELYQAQLDDLPAVVDGYQLLLDVRGRSGAISAPDGAMLLDRLPPDVFDLWVDVTHARGRIVVFAGALRLSRLHDSGDVDAVFQLLDEARRRGDVVTGQLAVNEAGGERDAVQHAAADLERLIHVSRPGDGSRLDAMPPLVPFPVPPRLLVATFADTPTLVIDLDDEDDDRARRTFKAFQRAGLAIVQEGRVWKAMPDGWGGILWPSQALIQAIVNDEVRKVLFADYDDLPAGLTWYAIAKNDPSMSVCVIVTNLKGRPISDQLVMNRIRRGRVLGGVVSAMATI